MVSVPIVVIPCLVLIMCFTDKRGGLSDAYTMLLVHSGGQLRLSNVFIRQDSKHPNMQGVLATNRELPVLSCVSKCFFYCFIIIKKTDNDLNSEQRCIYSACVCFNCLLSTVSFPSAL